MSEGWGESDDYFDSENVRQPFDGPFGYQSNISRFSSPVCVNFEAV